jgi:hypothetical protein
VAALIRSSDRHCAELMCEMDALQLVHCLVDAELLSAKTIRRSRAGRCRTDVRNAAAITTSRAGRRKMLSAAKHGSRSTKTLERAQGDSQLYPASVGIGTSLATHCWRVLFYMGSKLKTQVSNINYRIQLYSPLFEMLLCLWYVIRILFLLEGRE